MEQKKSQIEAEKYNLEEDQERRLRWAWMYEDEVEGMKGQKANLDTEEVGTSAIASMKAKKDDGLLLLRGCSGLDDDEIEVVKVKKVEIEVDEEVQVLGVKKVQIGIKDKDEVEGLKVKKVKREVREDGEDVKVKVEVKSEAGKLSSETKEEGDVKLKKEELEVKVEVEDVKVKNEEKL